MRPGRVRLLTLGAWLLMLALPAATPAAASGLVAAAATAPAASVRPPVDALLTGQQPPAPFVRAAARPHVGHRGKVAPRHKAQAPAAIASPRPVAAPARRVPRRCMQVRTSSFLALRTRGPRAPPPPAMFAA